MDTQILIYASIWSSTAVFGLCLFALVKRKVPMSLDEAKVLWKIHKQNTNCSRNKWKPIEEKSGKITGFTCDCGYKYAQKGLFLSSKPKNPTIQEKARSRTTSAKSIAKFYASANQQVGPDLSSESSRSRASRKSLLK